MAGERHNVESEVGFAIALIHSPGIPRRSHVELTSLPSTLFTPKVPSPGRKPSCDASMFFDKEIGKCYRLGLAALPNWDKQLSLGPSFDKADRGGLGSVRVGIRDVR